MNAMIQGQQQMPQQQMQQPQQPKFEGFGGMAPIGGMLADHILKIGEMQIGEQYSGTIESCSFSFNKFNGQLTAGNVKRQAFIKVRVSYANARPDLVGKTLGVYLKGGKYIDFLSGGLGVGDQWGCEFGGKRPAKDGKGLPTNVLAQCASKTTDSARFEDDHTPEGVPRNPGQTFQHNDLMGTNMGGNPHTGAGTLLPGQGHPGQGFQDPGQPPAAAAPPAYPPIPGQPAQGNPQAGFQEIPGTTGAPAQQGAQPQGNAPISPLLNSGTQAPVAPVGQAPAIQAPAAPIVNVHNPVANQAPVQNAVNPGVPTIPNFNGGQQ